MSKINKNFFPKARTSEIIVQELPEETLVYDLQKNRAFLLNQTSAIIFRLSDGKNSISEISNLMTKKLNSNISDDFVWLALNELQNSELLEKTDELASNFANISRREIVKRVGLASMTALPLVASITAPMAVNAQSSAALGQACTTSLSGGQGNCQSNLRCVGSICVNCTPNGAPTPGGCTLADLSGARQCCSQTCSLSNNICTA